jgi:hypothetical protein
VDIALLTAQTECIVEFNKPRLSRSSENNQPQQVNKILRRHDSSRRYPPSTTRSYHQQAAPCTGVARNKNYSKGLQPRATKGRCCSSVTKSQQSTTGVNSSSTTTLQASQQLDYKRESRRTPTPQEEEFPRHEPLQLKRCERTYEAPEAQVVPPPLYKAVIAKPYYKSELKGDTRSAEHCEQKERPHHHTKQPQES